MAAVAARPPHAGSHYGGIPMSSNMNGVFTSPTESEFSEPYGKDPRHSVLEWDEAQVAEWLRSINCAQYIDLFRRNNINGENLIDMDQAMLKEMGVKKIGDRVRIGAQAKVFRNSVCKRTSKRNMNRLSLATLDNHSAYTPPSSGSPRALHAPKSSRAEKRMSRQLNIGDLKGLSPFAIKTSSRPNSPITDQESRSAAFRRGEPSPMIATRNKDGYFSQPPSAGARYTGSQRTTPLEAPQSARWGHLKASPSVDATSSSNIVGALPVDKPLIRVIFENGRCSVVNIEGCRTAEDIIRTTLRKGSLNENHFRSYCFWVMDGTDPDPAFCRRLGEAEFIKLCNDGVRSERGRLILRKIHAGEPAGEQLKSAARIAEQQSPEPPAIEVQSTNKTRSQMKIEKLIGEPLAAVSYPMSPDSQQQRNDYFDSQSFLSRNASQTSTASARARKLKDFYGARPPTELITQDLQSYFPEVAKEEMDRTVRMSIRRSRRLSRAVSRLSTVSSISVSSSLRDAPPLPSIADQWLRESGGQARIPGLRPLSVVRLGRPDSYRESVTGSMLEPLDEESPLEHDRKSFASFGPESGGSESGLNRNLSVTDPEGNTVMQSYFDEGASSPGGTDVDTSSLNQRLSQFIAEDGEEPDEELMEHLEKDSWDDLKYMKGAMIGQGSFGTVFLALHAVTAELMAVKQVEMPSNSGTAMDAKKNNMIEALQREISLLRDLKHPNIVQYLGSNSDECHLNIFLEYVAGGSVATMLVNYGTLGETLIANFVRQILQGLNYLHSKDIIHRDIKGANILVDNKGTVKISDFGISKRVEASSLLHPQPPFKRGGPRVSLQGSVFWMAPEVVRQTAYTKKADIWSLGCLIVEMFTGSHPHPNCTQLQAIFKIGGSGGAASENARPDLPEQASEDAKEFLRKTFEIEHEKRPTAEELMGYAFCAPGKA
ncbi:hypothetical protein BDY17DRAFT_305325 [Neohortaea acidophila]|uniref:mitogen-activated protein kinase n=1 Tax=Neohortaea acidophila TaxID=245834 RepID=A0A6A6PH37_9PEZI|nr:uncharacterized protein BDY17DRAFT_305325 [Neohortaea acidophila]KAF2479302.1 hypothetical protein BDY17DRAFT_305325 [Neohortaea acidophila]